MFVYNVLKELVEYNYAVVYQYGAETEVVRYEKRPVVARRSRLRKEPKEPDEGIHDSGRLFQNGEGVNESLHEEKTKSRSSIRRATISFRRLVKANLYGFGKPVLASFTYRENMVDIAQARADFSAFARRAERQFGQEFAYIVVMEFQKRGAVHFHAFLWGLSEVVIATERHARVVAALWGHGFVDLAQTDGNIALASYLAKYFQKGLEDSRLFGYRVYNCSRNCHRPKIDRDAILGAYELSTGTAEIYRKEYDTVWLGRGLLTRHLDMKYANG